MMSSASRGAARGRGAPAHTASIGLQAAETSDQGAGPPPGVYRAMSAAESERPFTNHRVSFIPPDTQPDTQQLSTKPPLPLQQAELTELPAPMPPQPLSVAPPTLPESKLRVPAALSSASSAPSYDSDWSDGFSYPSDSSDSGDDDNLGGAGEAARVAAARLSRSLNGPFTAVDPTLVWPCRNDAVSYLRDVEALRSKVLYVVAGSNSNGAVLRCASGLPPGTMKARPRGPRNASGTESGPAHQADASASEATPAAPPAASPILLAAPALIADSSDPFGAVFSAAWRSEELTPSAEEARQDKLFIAVIAPATGLEPPEVVVANHATCGVCYRLARRKMGWIIKVEGAEHSVSCAAPCRVGFKRIADLEPVQLLVSAREPNCCKRELARQMATHLPPGQHMDAVLCSRVVRWCDTQADMRERREYGLIAPWALRATALNAGLVVVMGVKITGTNKVVDFWRRWSHDPAQPDKVRHESEWLRGPLAVTDAAVFDYVVLINPAARGLSSVMQNIISLDGTYARRFGQVLLVGCRINGHNVALAAILGRTESGLNYSRLLGHLFSVVPEMAARPPTVASDRGAAIIAAVEAFEPEMRAIAQKLWTERFEKAQAQRAPGEEEHGTAQFINRVVLEASKLQLNHINCLPHLLRNIHKHFSDVNDAQLWRLFLAIQVDDYERMLSTLDEAAKPKRAAGQQTLSAYLASSHGAGATKGPAA